MSQLADIIRFTIPISSMGAFIPYNLTAVVKN